MWFFSGRIAKLETMNRILTENGRRRAERVQEFERTLAQQTERIEELERTLGSRDPGLAWSVRATRTWRRACACTSKRDRDVGDRRRA
jgi:hypothetical protein